MGTPNHPCYLRTNEERRDKRKCDYYQASRKWCKKAALKCIGSAHCEHYCTYEYDRENADAEQYEPVVQKVVDKPKQEQVLIWAGQRVCHTKFGYGVIKTIEKDESGKRVRFVVLFDEDSKERKFVYPQAFVQGYFKRYMKS